MQNYERQESVQNIMKWTMPASVIECDPQDLSSWHRRAFTLIELLIVVAIIGILATIAIQNFLAAQTRAKVARVRADLATVNGCLECYRMDQNDYPPNDGVFNVLPINITTPISYITQSNLIDPFTSRQKHPIYGDLAKFYTYSKIVTHKEWLEMVNAGVPLPPIESVDSPSFNNGALGKYGRWRTLSNGPDGKYADPSLFSSDYPLYGSDVSYDPTNGVVSWGNILRTQKSTVGIVQK